jgi:hypothetical protein
VQTNFIGDTNEISITFDSLMDGSSQNLRRGDTLFKLIRSTKKLETIWHALEPRLIENPTKECKCFVQAKITQTSLIPITQQ